MTVDLQRCDPQVNSDFSSTTDVRRFSGGGAVSLFHRLFHPLEKLRVCLTSVCVHTMLVAGLLRVPNTSFPRGVPRQCHNRPADPHFLILARLRSIRREHIMALFWSG